MDTQPDRPAAFDEPLTYNRNPTPLTSTQWCDWMHSLSCLITSVPGLRRAGVPLSSAAVSGRTALPAIMRLSHLAIHSAPQHHPPLGAGSQGSAARDHRGVLLPPAEDRGRATHPTAPRQEPAWIGQDAGGY